MRFLLNIYIIAFATLFFGRALAAPPIAPSGLTVQTLGVNSFLLTWNDNSPDEDYFRTEARFVGQTSWISLETVPAGAGGTITWYQIIGTELTSANLEFQIVAVKGAEQSFSNTFAAPTTPSVSLFNAPTGLTGSANDGVITLSWNDNANSEWGYEVENRVGTSGNWIPLGATQPNQNINLAIGGHAPDTVYQYRVRAWKGNPAVFTVYSNTFTISTLPLAPPTNLSATLANERDLTLAWSDNSQAESGYALEYRVAGNAEWTLLGTVGANVTSTIPITNFFDPATDYEFRMTAVFSDPDFDEQFSEPSNIAGVSTLFAPPSALLATPVDGTKIQLTWQDHSLVEQGYGIFMRKSGDEDFFLSGLLGPNAELVVVQLLEPGTAYDFRVAAAYQANVPESREGILFSEVSNTASAATRDGMTSPVYVEAVLGKMFEHVIGVTTNSPLQGLVAVGLPPGVTQSATHVLSGVPTAAGVFECPLELTFENGWTQNISLTLRVLHPPVAGSALPASHALSPGGSASFDLSAAFTDPDADSAVRIATTLGDLHAVLFDSLTPLTVSNFMAYALAGDFADTVFHRNVRGFVVQGGAFRPDPANGPTAYTAVPTRPPVPNEPGLSSVRGTLAMAKLGGDPDSATNQFFVNHANNGPILNNQNGGFTVFGRLLLADLTITDAMEDLPIGDYAITLDGNPRTFEDWPLTGESFEMDNRLAVKILSVTPIPVLAFAVVSNSQPDVISATVSGDELSLQALRGGSSTLVIRATDLDGNTFDQTLVSTVPLTFADWTGDEELPPGGNADGGLLPDFDEFAFMGDPNNPADDAVVRPVLARSGGLLSVEFNLRKGAHLEYVLHAANQLAPPDWTEIWRDTVDGVDAPNVQSLTDLGTHYRLRVEDGASAGPRFLLLEVREPAAP